MKGQLRQKGPGIAEYRARIIDIAREIRRAMPGPNVHLRSSFVYRKT